ncbi:MAG: AAA family ATPase [Candidatus Nanoarchaeia archaeon]|nr:AAA family ATPase [Candidatus Nanoarchaeia archaeon]
MEDFVDVKVRKNDYEDSKDKKENKIDSKDEVVELKSTIYKLKEENRFYKESLYRAKQELKMFREPPLMIVEIEKKIDNEKAIIKIPNGNVFLVNLTEEINNITAGDYVAVDQRNLNIIKKVDKISNFDVEKFIILSKPDIDFKQIGGLAKQKEKIREVVELPLKSPELFREIGIVPPKGILLHGPPGTGKTLLAKAVAKATDATFIEIVGSELVQKFIGEGAKLVKEVFELARAKAPVIIFIDELDSIAAKRVEMGTSGEREVQRTFMQLLAELDGFKPLDNVKIIGATNRLDILDPAIIRPGRLDRIIEVGKPKEEERMSILKIHTKGMQIDEDVDFKVINDRLDGFTGAQIKSLVTEAGYNTIKEKRKSVSQKDFMKAIKELLEEEDLSKQYSMFI